MFHQFVHIASTVLIERPLGYALNKSFPVSFFEGIFFFVDGFEVLNLKVENCSVGVMVGKASSHGSSMQFQFCYRCMSIPRVLVPESGKYPDFYFFGFAVPDGTPPI